MPNTQHTLHPFERDSSGNIGGANFKGDWVTLSFILIAVGFGLYMYFKNRYKKPKTDAKNIAKDIFNIK